VNKKKKDKLKRVDEFGAEGRQFEFGFKKLNKN
jgi:hypothetical protein